jgi:hypothetical protein
MKEPTLKKQTLESEQSRKQLNFHEINDFII